MSDISSGINFDLSAAIETAQCTRQQFAQICAADATGLHRFDKPDWARRDLSRLGTVQAVVRKIGSNTFARRRPEDEGDYLAYVEQRLAQGAPLQFRLGCGPLKNRQVCGSAQQPDCAEYLMFVQLARFTAAVAALYPHGIQVQMVPDDQRSCHANLCHQAQVCSYIGGLQNMVGQLGFDGWLQIEPGQQRLYAEYDVLAYRKAAEDYMHEWRARDPEAYDAKWQSAVENAANNLYLPDWPDEKIRTEAEHAAWRYLVAHQSELLSGLWSPKDRFPLRYGRHARFYQLYTMKESQGQLPWQISLPFPPDAYPVAAVVADRAA